MVDALSLMKSSEGGMDWPTICELDNDEFEDFLEAAATLEKHIAKAMKG